MVDLLDRYLAALQEAMASPGNYEVLPGVHDVMDELDGHGAVHALGTGNLEHGAEVKLVPGNLWRRFRFGGFGSDAEEREDILRAAWRRAEAHLGRTVRVDEFVVVGDTPRDVTAAAAVGMACVAVATGRFAVEDLRGHGAEDALGNLCEDGAARRILTARRR